MSIGIILAIIICIYIIYVITVYVYRLNYVQKPIDSRINNGTDKKVYNGKTFVSTPFGSGERQTFSLWFYVNNLSYRKGQKKHIFTKMLNDITTLDIHVDKHTADVMCEYKHEKGDSKINMGPVDLKKWNHLVIVQDRHVIDVFINGKIAMTSNQDIPVRSGLGETVIISNNGGFKGFTGNFQYFNYNIHMQKIRSLLEAGPLVMNRSNPLYYIYVGFDYLSAFNIYVLTMFLIDPTKYAQHLYMKLNIPEIPEVPIECKVTA